ncbi:LysM domain-containing protein [Granulicella mallensis]|uniref:LysM domain-containing protein n=1 Tax=Granulicella mallensis TaxID=940614 RepID=A0A7W7ZV19_9BACT|nr:LysM domain-containing protein [Granulicella mallensis]MBB5066697.1 hypothetical protein [Granulicella mallensis]
MATPTPSRPDTSGLTEAWLRGIPHTPLDPDWSVYDNDIAVITRTYNEYLAKQQGFVPLDPLLVKAMCWTETGANVPEWRTRPMQIGNAGDAGLAELLKTKPLNRLLLPPAFYKGGALQLTSANVRTIPAFNIRAGIGYLLLRACRLNGPWLPVDNGQTFSDKVRKGDSLDRIAARDHTTVDELRNANPKLNPSALKLGAELSFRHMTEYFFLGFVGRVDEARAAATYNNNDVDGYTKKLLYCMWVFQGGAQAEDAAKAAALATVRKGK